jgi:hypothetical protein
MSARLFTRWQEAEERFACNGYNGESKAPLYEAQSRDHVLMLTSIHGVNHPRDGRVKTADRMTGGLVDVLGREYGLPTFHNCRFAPELEPSEELTPAEQHIFSQPIPPLVLDIHAAKPDCGFDLCVGTGPWEPSMAQEMLFKRLRGFAQGHNLHCALNVPNYSALIRPAMTRRVKERGFDGMVQLEINTLLLRSSGYTVKVAALLHTFNLLAASFEAARN